MCTCSTSIRPNTQKLIRLKLRNLPVATVLYFCVYLVGINVDFECKIIFFPIDEEDHPSYSRSPYSVVYLFIQSQMHI